MKANSEILKKVSILIKLLIRAINKVVKKTANQIQSNLTFEVLI